MFKPLEITSLELGGNKGGGVGGGPGGGKKLTVNGSFYKKKPMKDRTSTREPNLKKRNYDQAFQRSAAEMVIVGGKTIVEVARDLGINKYTLKNWKNKTLKQMGEVKVNGQPRTAVELEADNRQLRKELEYVKRQREILKKAMSILGEEPAGGMR